MCAARRPPSTALPPIQASTAPAICCSPQRCGAGGRWVPEHGPAGRRAAERITAMQRGHARARVLRRGDLAEAARAPRSALGGRSANTPTASWHAMQHGGELARRRHGDDLRHLQAQATGQSHHVRTDGCDLPRCSLSRPYTIRPRVDGLCSCSQEAAQVVAGPEPRRHAAMLRA